MKKVVSLALALAVVASIAVGILSISTQAGPPTAVQCIIKCNIKTHDLFECCREVTPGGGGKWECELIGGC
jgi:hypothetical protein